MTDKALERILAVENDPDMATVVGIALEALGNYQVKVCQTGQEALTKLATFEPDLFLLAAELADFELLPILKKNRLAPVIFMANASVEEVSRILKAGADGVITRPFDPLFLPDLVQNLWQKAL